MTTAPYDTDRPTKAPRPGEVEIMAPGIGRILAPNPSPMTHWGTNTYLVDDGAGGPVTIVDPGPDDAAHLDALLDAIGGRDVGHIAVTHAHRDHSALAARLARKTGAPVAAFGTATAGRSAVMTHLVAEGMTGGGEGLDLCFAPDRLLVDGDRLGTGDAALKVVHTPGHLGGHLCFARGDAWFTGDHVMGWAPSLVSPPDGDLGDFMSSCARLASLAGPGATAFPGHGGALPDLAMRLAHLIAHRRQRETQILAALREAPGTPVDLALRIYTDVAPALLPAAARNVLAHLIDLTHRGLSRCTPPLTSDTLFHTI